MTSLNLYTNMSVLFYKHTTVRIFLPLDNTDNSCVKTCF